MKYFNLIFTLFLGFQAYSQNCNIGNEAATPEYEYTGFVTGYFVGQSYNLTQTGVLQSINLVGNNTGEGVQMAVYNDNGGIPNNLIASVQGIVGNGICTFPVAPTLLIPGNYWIMATYEIGINPSLSCPCGGNLAPNYSGEVTFGNPVPSNASNFIPTGGTELLYFLEISCGNSLATSALSSKPSTSVSPNPAQYSFTVVGLQQEQAYTLYNVMGEEVQKGIVQNQQEINIENLSTGTYYLNLENGEYMKIMHH